MVTAKLICVFVFAYAKKHFSHGKAHTVINIHCLAPQYALPLVNWKIVENDVNPK